MPTPEQEAKDLIDPILAAFRTRLQATILQHAVTGYINGSAQMISYGKTILKGRPIVYEGPPMQQAIDYANKRAARMVTQINAETRDRLAKTIADGIKNKRGIDGLARDIRTQFSDMTKNRSLLIARTETNESLSAGSFERGKAMGVTGKRWLTVGDHNVRDAHRENEAAGVIPWDEPFPDGSMAPPGNDPFNCRCVLVPVMLEEQ